MRRRHGTHDLDGQVAVVPAALRWAIVIWLVSLAAFAVMLLCVKRLAHVEAETPAAHS